MAKPADIVRESLIHYGRRAMRHYGSHVNEDRAFPDYRDGFKPVARRIMWALHCLPGGHQYKTARIIGDTLGKYHPHGDEPCQKAIETLIHSCSAPITGHGNWGTILEPAAAMRYTEMRLSKYGETFFSPDHLAVLPLVANYDGSTTEPVLIPALLPNLLLNGYSGVGYGTSGECPAYTPETLLPMCVKILKGFKPKPKDWLDLEMTFKWGGRVVRSKENQEALLNFYKTGKGSIRVRSQLEVDKDRGLILWKDFAPEVNPNTGRCQKIRELPGVKGFDNVSDKKNPTAFLIRYNTSQINDSAGGGKKVIDGVLRKVKAGDTFTPFMEKLIKLTSSTISYDVKVTKRTMVDGKVEASFFAPTVPELLNMWLKWRVKLEIKSLEYRVKKVEKEIAWTKLLIYAITKLDVIFKALKQEDTVGYMVKHMEITADQANQILDRNVRSLSKLTDNQLEGRLKEQKAHLKELKEWQEKPVKKVAHDIEAAIKVFAT